MRGGSCDIACLRGEDGNFERSPLEKGDGDGWCLVMMDLPGEYFKKNEDED